MVELSFPTSIDEEAHNKISGYVTGKESIGARVTDLLNQYMHVTERIDKIMIELKQLRENNNEKSGKEPSGTDNKEMQDDLQEKVQKLIEEHEQLRSDLNTGMDTLEKEIKTIGSTAEATKKESTKLSKELASLKSKITDMQNIVSKLDENYKNDLPALILESKLQTNQKEDLQKAISKLEDCHKKELQSLKSKLQTQQEDLQKIISRLEDSRGKDLKSLDSKLPTKQEVDLQTIISRLEDNQKKIQDLEFRLQTAEEQIEKGKKGLSEEMNQRIRSEILQQLRKQGKYAAEVPPSSRRYSYRTHDHRKHLSLPDVPLREDHETKSLPHSSFKQRNMSKISNDSGYSQMSATTPEEENSFEVFSQNLQRPPSAQSFFSGRLHKMTPLPRIQRPKSSTEHKTFRETR